MYVCVFVCVCAYDMYVYTHIVHVYTSITYHIIIHTQANHPAKSAQLSARVLIHRGMD